MVKEELRKYINEENEDALLFDNPSFDNSIIGMSTDGRVIYSLHKMVEELATEDEIAFDEALEFIDYNTIRALIYISDSNKPIILDDLSFIGECE